MGRKSFKDEIQIVKYLTALAPQTFKYIEAMYETGDKPDKKWAIEQMIKLYGKAMPTEITGEGGGALIISYDSAFKQNDPTPETTGDSPEQSQV